MAPQPGKASRRHSSRSHARKSAAIKAASDMPVVAVGASADGISAFQIFAENIPKDAGIAWVFIQHMAPDRESHLSQILAQRTSLPVTQVVKPTQIQPDSVYVIGPGHTMTLHDGILRTVTTEDPLARRSSIDAFFLSLAEERGERSGCALLSGAGTDGTIGLKAVKEAGGLTLTQTLVSAEYDSMLLSAVQTGLVDRELSIEEMGATFVDFLVRHQPLAAEEAVRDGDRLRICQLVHNATGHDFSGYKRNTIERRVRRRMQILGLSNLQEYLEQLRSDSSEATLLFRDLLIGVTQFFRDKDAFQAVCKEVLPKILEGKTADDEVRIWTVGCATGEETYRLNLVWEEEGGPSARAPKESGFGTRFIQRSTQYELRGNCRFVYRRKGLRCSLELPIDQVAIRPADRSHS